MESGSRGINPSSSLTTTETAGTEDTIWQVEFSSCCCSVSLSKWWVLCVDCWWWWMLWFSCWLTKWWGLLWLCISVCWRTPSAWTAADEPGDDDPKCSEPIPVSLTTKKKIFDYFHVKQIFFLVLLSRTAVQVHSPE